MKTQGLENGWETEEGRTQELAAYAEELIKEFPEIALRSWCFSHRYRDGQFHPGVVLNLTGPAVSVKAFLVSLGLARNLDHIQITEGINPETGRTFGKPGKRFKAYLAS